MTTRKKALAVLLATLQVAWSFSWGAYEAVAQVVNTPAARAQTGGVPVVPASAIGAFSPVGQPLPLSPLSLSASLVPRPAPPPAAARPSTAPLSRAAAVRALAPTASPALSADAKDGSAPALRRDAPVEDSSRAGAESFSALYPEALIEGSKGTLADPVQAPAAASRRTAFRFAPV